ncbi:VanZ family protein [Microbacterium sp. HJ5]
MSAPTRRQVGVLWALGVYVVVVAVVVLSPVSYRSIVHAIGDGIRDVLGVSPFGTGWIEFGANILMFVPLGLLLTLLLRNHWYGVVLALVLSAGVELAQIVIPSRQPSLRDIVANVLGAAVGAALAWIFVLRRRQAHRSDAPD